MHSYFHFQIDPFCVIDLSHVLKMAMQHYAHLLIEVMQELYGLERLVTSQAPQLTLVNLTSQVLILPLPTAWMLPVVI